MRKYQNLYFDNLQMGYETWEDRLTHSLITCTMTLYYILLMNSELLCKIENTEKKLSAWLRLVSGLTNLMDTGCNATSELRESLLSNFLHFSCNIVIKHNHFLNLLLIVDKSLAQNIHNS